MNSQAKSNTELTFTPGPHRVQQEGVNKFIVRDSRGAGMCTVLGHRKRGMQRAKKDAQLFAAAPDLYEAAYEAFQDLQCQYDGAPDAGCQWMVDALTKLEAALAKARGEATS